MRAFFRKNSRATVFICNNHPIIDAITYKSAGFQELGLIYFIKVACQAVLSIVNVFGLLYKKELLILNPNPIEVRVPAADSYRSAVPG